MEKQTFSGNYEADIAALNLRLRVSESFDLVSRQIIICGRAPCCGSSTAS